MRLPCKSCSFIYKSHFYSVYLLKPIFQPMYSTDFLFKKVAFNQYFDDSGKRIKAKGFIVNGKLFDFVHKKTENGLEIVGVVLSEKKKVVYVPTISLIVME